MKYEETLKRVQCIENILLQCKKELYDSMIGRGVIVAGKVGVVDSVQFNSDTPQYSIVVCKLSDGINYHLRYSSVTILPEKTNES